MDFASVQQFGFYMNYSPRCNCPVTSALDILGDKWTLVIIKQILIEGKQTFKEFLESDEAIATNILSSRLKMLEEFDVITKGKPTYNKKTNIYRLTDKGISLTPIIAELGIWSDANMRGFNPDIIAGKHMDDLKNNKEQFIFDLQQNYREKLDLQKAKG